MADRAFFAGSIMYHQKLLYFVETMFLRYINLAKPFTYHRASQNCGNDLLIHPPRLNLLSGSPYNAYQFGESADLINLENDMQHLYNKTVIATTITAAIYLILYFFFDKAIDLWIHHNCSNTWLFNLGTFISRFAKNAPIKLGIALCFMLMIISDPRMKRRSTKYVLYICTSVSIAIIIGDGLKYLLGRYRPIMLFEKNLYGLHLFSSDWSLNSTPSGHTLRAFAILTALSLLYRRFMLVFILFAAVIGASRVIVTDHYPSDVVFGAFIGIFTASWTYKYFFIQDRFPARRS